MSNISPQGEASSSEEIELLTALNNLAVSGASQAIRKSGLSSFENINLVNVSATWGSIIGTLSDQADLQNSLDEKQAIYFDRIGTTLEPHTANDNIDMGSGDITTTGTGNFNDIIATGAITDGTASLTGGSLTSVKLGTLTSNGFVKTGSGDGTLSVDTEVYAPDDQTFYIGTTQVAINRASGALTLAGLTLTTPDIGTPSAGTLTNCSFPTLNQNTTGTAANLSGTPDLPNGTTDTTQSASDNSTKLATTAYADTAAAGGGATAALDNLAGVAINETLVSDTDITDDLGTGDVRWKDLHIATVNSGLTATDTLKLRGRDVDGSAYVDILTITSANTVTADLNALVTIGGNAILYSGGDAGTPSAGVLTNCSGYEGTAVISTGEEGGTKYLREDGDGTCSWQAAAGGGCSFGADNQIPYTNVTTDDFDYSAGFTFDGTDAKLKADNA